MDAASLGTRPEDFAVEMISRETVPGFVGRKGGTMKFGRGFSEATLNILLTQALPLGDILSGGKVSAVSDDLAAHAGALKKALKEASDLMGAIQAALKDGATSEEVSAVIAEAKEAKAAIAALRPDKRDGNEDDSKATKK